MPTPRDHMVKTFRAAQVPPPDPKRRLSRFEKQNQPGTDTPRYKYWRYNPKRSTGPVWNPNNVRRV